MPHILWYFIALLLLIYRLKNKKRKLMEASSILLFALFLLCSTRYFPLKLLASIESTYNPIAIEKLDRSKSYYIYVLGAGSAADHKLPATMNLSAPTLIRLVEGIRIYNCLSYATIVTSAASKDELISQAQLSKEAAVSLGMKEQHIQMLETATSTLEEAIAFKEKFGTNKNVILVTSALHMPRAVEIFSDQGIKVLPAPTDYMAKNDDSTYSNLSFPSFASIGLLNSYQTAVVKHLYYKWFKKPKKANKL